ncbi:MAG: GNAT family N-acetyltransferase [Chloroflexota bacterium]|nr:GNAT family N-acetyltransferase [Chloroflexota bacterium]
MHARHYDGAEDLLRLQRFNAEQIASGGSAWLQPGDIPHRLYNGLRGRDPSKYLRLWEDKTGAIAGWVILDPPNTFDIQSAREDVIVEALAWVERQLRAKIIETDLSSGNDPRRDVLMRLGMTEVEDEPPYHVTERSLSLPLAEVSLPDGFSIRTAAGVHEAAMLADVHAGSFDSDWTPELYARVMQSPGYAAEREFVVVAPDGRFAAFTVTWHDTLNKSGYFEPVGTHKDFRRLGLARALMTHAMHAMRAAGLEAAIVVHEPPEENPASASLYASLGFQTRYTTHLYRKVRTIKKSHPPAAQSTP